MQYFSQERKEKSHPNSLRQIRASHSKTPLAIIDDQLKDANLSLQL